MKVLIINKLYSPWIGGVEKIVQQIAEGLNKKRVEIEVLCCQVKGRKKEEKINGVKVCRASSSGLFWGMPISFSFPFLFKKTSKNFDVINIHHPFPLVDLSIFLFQPKAKLIVHYHSDIVRQRFFNFLINPLINHTLKKAEKIIVSNPNLIKSSSNLRKFKEKCQIIPFGVDLSAFEQSSETETEKIKEKYKNFVLFVGRLNYYKGLQYLIESMKNIDANLVIIGDGLLKKSLELQVSNLKMKNKVFFLPFMKQNELINFYKACAVFVLPSIFKSEAFGIVLIEAMACAKPIISTELKTGTSWVNLNNQTGFVIPPKNAAALTSAIETVLKNKNLAEKFGQNAQARAKKEFSLEKMLEKTENIYKSL